jgi:hypothetical protein
MKPPINMQYQDDSGDADRNCGACFHFNAADGAEQEGRCFGYETQATGVCRIFADRKETERGVSAPPESTDVVREAAAQA